MGLENRDVCNDWRIRLERCQARVATHITFTTTRLFKHCNESVAILRSYGKSPTSVSIRKGIRANWQVSDFYKSEESGYPGDTLWWRKWILVHPAIYLHALCV